MVEYILSLFCPLYLTFAAGCSILFVLRKILSRNLPPGPFSLPIFGSVGFFRAFKRRRHLFLSDVAEKYGNIFTVYAGTQMVVFLNGYETIYQAFVKKSQVFSERPNWLPSLQNGLSEGKGKFFACFLHNFFFVLITLIVNFLIRQAILDIVFQ